jgi:hypothetical protein
MTAPTEITARHADTREGALAALRALSWYMEDVSDESVSAYADPWVRGVWKIEHIDPENRERSFEAIVYLAGHPDPMGDTREYNDFEGSSADEWDDEAWEESVIAAEEGGAW